ncbi:MAG: hypothetical protein IT162_05450 [Bryobacterales bacterium]|nr:hypothetical protein [Bryobacterales bacterium]
MAKPTPRKPSNLWEVECPCCDAILRIDPETRAVITHQAKEKPAPVEDLAAAVRRLKEEEAQRGDKFQKHVDDQRNRQAVLNKKFDELFKQAHEDPESLQPKPKVWD